MKRHLQVVPAARRVVFSKVKLPLMNPLLHSQVGQNLGLLFSRCQNFVARGTVICDGLAVGTRMAAIVAAEAAWKIVVSKIVWVNAPGHTHVWEDVAKVNPRHLFGGLLHHGTPCLVDLRIIRSIEIVELTHNALLCHISGRVIHFEQLNCLLLDVG